MEAALISAAAAITIAALTPVFTKAKKREALWRSKKLDYYEQFFRSVSGIAGGKMTPPEAKVDFANSVNSLHLIASQDVIDSLHELCDEIAEPNAPNFNQQRHDRIWSDLVWHIRADLGDAPRKTRDNFVARLWASGTGSNLKLP